MKKILQYIGLVVFVVLTGMVSRSCNKAVTHPEKTTYDLTVIVTDESSRPMQDAVVTIEKVIKRTDAEGKCTFPGLTSKWVWLEITADYYLPVGQSVTLEGRPDEPLTVMMSKGQLYVTVDTPEIDTKEGKYSKRIKVQSNTDWKIETSSPELSFSTTEGYGNQEVNVVWSFSEEQPDEDLAVAEFTIVSQAEPVTVPIRYHLPIRLVKSEGIAANLVLDHEAFNTVRLTFSRKVVPVEVWTNYERLQCQAVDDYTVEISIPTGWSKLGGTYSISQVKVKSANGDGVLFDKEAQVDFFDGIAQIEGILRHWSLSEDESRLWVSTEFPNRIYELDARTFEVLKSFDLDWQPGKHHLNPYNNLLYVTDQPNEALKVLDPGSGKTLKTIKLKPSVLDHPQTPRTIPYNILFADNGLGVLVAADIDNYYRWYFIDSRHDNLVETNPLEEEFGDEIMVGDDIIDYCFNKMYLDHTRTKVIGSPLTYLSQWTYFIDCNDKTVSLFQVDKDFGAPPMDKVGGVILDHKPHKEKDLMLFCAPFSTVVYDYANKTYTWPFVDGFQGTVNDFCYGSFFGDDICTYSIFEGGMTIFNHSKGTAQFGNYLMVQGSAFKGFLTFKGQDRIVLYGFGQGTTTTFVTLNTSRFFQ